MIFNLTSTYNASLLLLFSFYLVNDTEAETNNILDQIGSLERMYNLMLENYTRPGNNTILLN